MPKPKVNEVDSIIISLSSDEEEIMPEKKRVKLMTLTELLTPKPSSSKTTESSCIVLSDDTDEDILKPNSAIELVDMPIKPNEEPEPPASPKLGLNGIMDHDHSSITKLYNDFINNCKQNIKVTEHRTVVDEKTKFMQDAFDEYLQFANDFSSFQQCLENNLENVSNKPKRALVYFADVYQILKASLRDVTEGKETISGKEKTIKRLERVLAKLKKRIDKLEQAECNFSDEENSSYMQLSRYKQRAAEIHAKLCKYRKINPYSGRILHQRLKFDGSKYPEINEIINKKYKNSTVFPTRHEIQKLIGDYIADNSHISMSLDDIEIEAKQCFKKLGYFIQSQRKLELYLLHSDYLADVADDPAKDNPTLQGKLLKSYQIKVEKENKIFDKFEEMQNKGGKCSDSEEASINDSNSDNDENEANEVNNIECITID